VCGSRRKEVPIERYRVYGVTIESDYPFGVPLPLSDAPPDLGFELTRDPPAGVSLAHCRPLYTEGERDDGRPVFAFYALEDRAVVRISGAMDFHCLPDRIVCHLHDPAHSYLMDVALFGMVMSLWLERQGVPTLHASTVRIGDRAVAFLSGRAGGKTSTASACLAAGHTLVSDDLLALTMRAGRVLAQPGYPQMRMWRDQARHFLGSEEAGAPYHPDYEKRRISLGDDFGSFEAAPAPLSRLYLPERSGDPTAEVTISTMPPRVAVMALIRQSFLPREVVRFGLQAARLEFFARLLLTVPVRRLIVPHGLGELPRVVAAIEADVHA
jgi:hypothetical protein